MSKLLHHLLIRPLVALLLVLVLLLVGVVLLSLSSSGTHFLANLAQRFVPEFEMEGAEGALLHGLTLSRLRWKNPQVEIEATKVSLQNELDIGAPLTVRALSLHADKLVVRQLLRSSPAVSASEPFQLPSITLPFNLDVQQVTVGELEVWWGAKPLRFRRVQLSARTRDGALQLDSLQAQAYDAQGQADLLLGGNMALSGAHVLDAQLSVNANSKTWGVGKANVRLGGELQHYRLDADADWQYAAYPRYRGTLQGNGTFGGLAVSALQLDGAAGKLVAKGDIGWKQGFTWKADITGTGINPEPFASGVPGKLDAALVSSGTWAGGKTSFMVDVSKLQGKLRDYPVDAKGRGDWDGKRLALQQVSVLAGNNQLQAEGKVGETADLHWKVDAKNLAQVWKGLEGHVQGEGTLKGTLAQPTLQADLQGGKLRYQNYRLDTVDVQAKQDGGRYGIKGNVQGFSGAGMAVKSAKIDAQGTLENHRLSAQLTNAEGKADFAANGGWKNGQWAGSVQNLSLRDTPAGDWNMAGAINLSASSKAFSSSEICLTHQASRACGKPAWTPQGGFNISGTLRQIPLVMARPWLPDTLGLPGNADADYQFEAHSGKPTAKVALRLPDNALTLRDRQGKSETLQYSGAHADLSLNDRRMEVQAQLGLANRGQVRAAGRIDLSPSDGLHRIDAHLNTVMADIAWLEKFSPQIDQLKGSVTGDVQVTGLLSKPNVTGTAKLVNGQVHLPETGVTLDAIGLMVQADGADHATISGSLRAGQGVLNAHGSLSLAHLPNWQAEVSLQGHNLKLMDTHEVQAWVSPDLQIQASPGQVAVTGKLLIPESTISLRELPPTASVHSADVVIVGRRAPQRQPGALAKDAPLDIQPNVTITLGDKVKFTGFGLDARLTGNMQVLRTRQDIVAEGALNVVEGRYKAYGQNLTIERGRLVFNGPIDNPGLDVRAVREVENDIKVGIELTGTVQKPESTLFSTPTQTQSDTLSYLLTGHSMSNVTGNESSVLMQAVTGLGVAGGENLAQQIGGQFGLDDVGLNSKSGKFQETELSLGKRLGPRLYLKYIVSLFDSLQRVAISYQINKHLQLQAQSGTHQGVDLIYKIDTDTGPLGR